MNWLHAHINYSHWHHVDGGWSGAFQTNLDGNTFLEGTAKTSRPETGGERREGTSFERCPGTLPGVLMPRMPALGGKWNPAWRTPRRSACICLSWTRKYTRVFSLPRVCIAPLWYSKHEAAESTHNWCRRFRLYPASQNRPEVVRSLICFIGTPIGSPLIWCVLAPNVHGVWNVELACHAGVLPSVPCGAIPTPCRWDLEETF